MHRRQLRFGLLVVATALLITNTATFSAVSADRAVAVRVVEDPKAFLGIVEGCDDDATLTLINQFGVALDAVAVTWESGARTVGPLGPGESAAVTVPGVGTGDVVHIEAEGDGVRVAKSKGITVSCGTEGTAAIGAVVFCVEGEATGGASPNPCPDGEGPVAKFEWNGSAFVPEGDGAGVTVDATELDEDGEPVAAEWASPETRIDTVVVKSATGRCEEAGGSSGVIESCGPPPGGGGGGPPADGERPAGDR